MNRLSFFTAIVVILVATLSVCGCTQADQIAFIINDPSQFNGKTVDISGSVENILWNSNTSNGAYQVFDGSGDIWVVTNQNPPAKGRNVTVKGTLSSHSHSMGKRWHRLLMKLREIETFPIF